MKTDRSRETAPRSRFDRFVEEHAALRRRPSLAGAIARRMQAVRIEAVGYLQRLARGRR
jgi:hypothetical protein